MRTIKVGLDHISFVDDADYELVNKYKWSLSKEDTNIYACRRESYIDDLGVKHSRKIRMHRMIMGDPVDMKVDHIDHCGLNNVRKNLRVCTSAENTRNRKYRGANKHGFKGIKNRGDTYAAAITISLKDLIVHGFKNPIDAAKGYDRLAAYYHGEFAAYNFPDDIPSPASVAELRAELKNTRLILSGVL